MSRITASTGFIDRVDVKSIRIFKNGDLLKWSNRLKNKNITLLNGAQTAKLSLFQNGEKAILGHASYTIGGSDHAWAFTVLSGSVIRIGVALITRNLSSLDENNDHAYVELNVLSADVVVCLVQGNSMVIEHGKLTYTIDLSQFVGETMHPWLSSVTTGSGFSVSIKQYRFFDITIDEFNVGQVQTNTTSDLAIPLNIDAGDENVDLSGTSVEITGLATQPGIDFSIVSGTTTSGLTIVDSNGSMCVDNILLVNSVEHKNTGPLILKGSSTAVNMMEIHDNGDVVINPGTVTTASIKAPVGDTTKITNDSGVGIHVETTGSVLFDVPPKFDVVTSDTGSDLQLIEGTNTGITIKDTTGEVKISNFNSQTIDTLTATTMSVGEGAVSVDISRVGVNTVFKGALQVNENISVTGDITVSGTVNGIDIPTNTTGVVTVHSDVTSAGSGAIISGAERTAIGTNNTNNTGVVTVHSDVTSAGSGIIISAAERTAIGTNTTNNAGVITVHSDVTSAGSGIIISAAERTQIGTNIANATTSINAHSDISTNILVDDDILAYNSTGGEWENKTIAALGLAAATHTHTPTDITDFDSATDLQIASQKGINNGIASLVAGKIPASQLAVTNLNKCGAWNADTNDPTLTSSVGVSGCIYVVSDAGSTDLNGITDWKVNDWVVFNGSVWEKVDNTNVVASVAGKTGAVTLISTDITDITSGGSGAIITGVERTAIGTNTSNNTGVVTVHSDVTDAGSGAIITGVERTAIGTNTTNNTGSVTVHSDVTSAGSGAIITSAERIAIAGGIGGTVDIHSDITSAGSGAIITGVERTAIGTNTTNNSGPVTVHSDVTSVGSGAIITGVERTAIGTNTTNNNGVVTVHSDVTDAGSGAIISGAERTAIGTNATNATLKMDLGGGVMAGDIDMGNADFKNITNQTLKGELTLGIAESAQRVIKTASGNNIVIENFTGASALTIKHQGGIDVSGVVSLSDTTNSTSTTSGSIVTTGGVGVAKKVNVGELIRLTHQSTTPSAPATGKGFIYVRNSTLYFMGDNGVEKTIATT